MKYLILICFFTGLQTGAAEISDAQKQTLLNYSLQQLGLHAIESRVKAFVAEELPPPVLTLQVTARMLQLVGIMPRLKCCANRRRVLR